MQKRKDIGRIIAIVSNQIKREFDAREPKLPFTGVQGRLLHFILLESESRDLFQKDLEDEFNLRRSTATGILQLMEKNGLLRREGVDYDARLKKIIVTDKGLEMKNLAIESILTIENKLKHGIPDAELQAFFATITKMSKNLE